MSRSESGPGGCISLIFIILVVGAAFGFFEWGTVGKFVRFFVYLAIAIAILIGGGILWFYFNHSDKGK